MTGPRLHIVDIQGLADVFLCSKDTIQRTWRRYPHFYITDGTDARAARFDVNDVLSFLKERDYGKVGDGKARSENKDVDRGLKDNGVSQETKKRIRNSRGRKAMGTGKKIKAFKPRKSPDPIEDFAREFGLS